MGQAYHSQDALIYPDSELEFTQKVIPSARESRRWLWYHKALQGLRCKILFCANQLPVWFPNYPSFQSYCKHNHKEAILEL